MAYNDLLRVYGADPVPALKESIRLAKIQIEKLNLEIKDYEAQTFMEQTF